MLTITDEAVVATPLQGINFHARETHCMASENNNNNVQVNSNVHSAIPLFLLAPI